MFISAIKHVRQEVRPMLFCTKISVFCSFNLGGGGRAGAKHITTNANTNENTGASVTVNSRAREAPSSAAAAQLARQGKRTGGKRKVFHLATCCQEVLLH